MTYMSYIKLKLQNLTLPQNRQRSAKGHHLNTQNGLESQMFRYKFHGNRFVGSGEEDF